MKFDRETMITSAHILDYPVVSPKGETLGCILEIIFNLGNGKISYVVLQAAANYGYGNKLYAIPWQSLSFKEIVGTYVLNLTLSKLTTLATIDPTHWPASSDPQCSAQIDSLSNSSQLDADPNSNPGNRSILTQAILTNQQQVIAELEASSDPSSLTPNPSEQAVYPGLQINKNKTKK